MKKKKEFWVGTASGLAVGAVNGFFGAGGGMIVVPLLQKIFQLESKKAHATAIITILPISLVSAATYVVAGIVETKPLLFVLLGSVVGALVGTFLLCKLKSQIISIVFYLLMFVAGIFMILTV